MTISDKINFEPEQADEEQLNDLCLPLARPISNRMPSTFDDIQAGELLIISEKKSKGGMLSVALDHPRKASKIDFSVRWIHDGGLGLLELNDRTLEPELGIPQVIVKILDSNTIEIISDIEFPNALELMNVDARSAATLSPAEWNARHRQNCNRAFQLG